MGQSELVYYLWTSRQLELLILVNYGGMLLRAEIEFSVESELTGYRNTITKAKDVLKPRFVLSHARAQEIFLMMQHFSCRELGSMVVAPKQVLSLLDST